MMKAVEAVIIRNKFYKDSYKLLRFFVLIVFIVNIVMAAIFSYVYFKPRSANYIAATDAFRLLNLHPMSDPVLSDQFVLQFASDSIQKAYNVDYLHWKRELANASTSFTTPGWNQFISNFKASNNLSTILKFHVVTDTKITGAPQLQQKGLLANGHYAWKVKVPILVQYFGEGQNIKMPMSVVLLLVRQPVSDHPERLAINNFIASTQDQD